MEDKSGEGGVDKSGGDSVSTMGGSDYSSSNVVWGGGAIWWESFVLWEEKGEKQGELFFFLLIQSFEANGKQCTLFTVTSFEVL